MSEFSCSICNYTSKIKRNVERHLTKKTKCGEGIGTIIESSIEIKCEFCNKQYSSIISHMYHIKNTCSMKDVKIPTATEIITNQFVEPLPMFEEIISNTQIEAFNSDSILDTKIKAVFNTEEQIMYSASFQGYLKHDTDAYFVIDLDNVWKWIGYSEKGVAKRALLKAECLEEDIDYIIKNKNENLLAISGKNLLDISAKQVKNLGGSGLNAETILLTITAFKKFCMMAGTKQAYKMHDYYIKLEKCLHETRLEEMNSMKTMLKDKDSLRELTLLTNFNFKNILYLIKISNDIVKFGFTCDINRRLKEHKSQIANDISLEFCIESLYNIELEKKLKLQLNNSTNLMQLISDKLKSRIFTQVYNEKSQTELIKLDSEFTMSKLQDTIVELNESINKNDVIRIQNSIITELMNR